MRWPAEMLGAASRHVETNQIFKTFSLSEVQLSKFTRKVSMLLHHRFPQNVSYKLNVILLGFYRKITEIWRAKAKNIDFQFFGLFHGNWSSFHKKSPNHSKFHHNVDWNVHNSVNVFILPKFLFLIFWRRKRKKRNFPHGAPTWCVVKTLSKNEEL